MPNAVFHNTYKLKKGSSTPDFIQAVKNLVTQYASKQKGFISCALFTDGEKWADVGIFETMEDAKSFENPTEVNEHAAHFYTFLNFNSCVSRMITVDEARVKDFAFIADIPELSGFTMEWHS